jgi:hypothetical protein
MGGRAVLLVALACCVTACGRGGGSPAGAGSAVAQSTPPPLPASSSCRTSPPDVIPIADVPLGGGGVGPGADERDAENRFAEAHADVYAGMVFGDGYDWIGFTADAQQHLAELRRVVPSPAMVRAFCARFTHAQLTALQSRIQSDFGWLHSQGIDVSSVGVDELSDHVGLTVMQPLDSRIVRLLRDRYGPMLGTIGSAIYRPV